ncbi:phosphatase PAP2 family protein [Rhodanobacter sp. MP7CTX1]|uniref:phosphatase PAP2 family protein n=1 Tax=Rhodanobacter sp. MP7CTX1 TaxID=2723084 RepID=UPI00160F6E5B|nr:phosphatase PAP2 family protein [Rhodanobacter sp. MP7CTX1]MBB6186534.1 membrane-associated phospholipid phosphatase [Rhodanobacter sp. MP7CTX1]
MLLDRQTWIHITALGDSAVTLPCIGLITLWLLLAAPTRGLVWRWLLLVVGVMGLVAVSKLAFMVWGVTLPGLEFTGLSGHSALAAVVWPAMGGLLVGRGGTTWRMSGVLLGLLLAVVIAWSRVVLHAHSVSEIVLGSAVGTVFSLVFLGLHWRAWRLPWPSYMALLPLLLVLPFVYGRHFPSQDMLVTIARHLSDGPLHTRQELHWP